MLKDRRYLAAVLGLHTALLIIGFVSQVWLLTAFCLWIRPEWIQIVLGLVWLALTASPLVGLLSWEFERLRGVYLTLAIATPLFWIGIMALNNADVLMCDAP